MIIAVGKGIDRPLRFHLIRTEEDLEMAREFALRVFQMPFITLVVIDS